LAGLWYGYISLPLFQFLLCRWYFRIFIWSRLLWQVSRIPLNLMPTHPDRVGGLGFLAGTTHAFVPLLTAHGALVAGQLANLIFLAGASLAQLSRARRLALAEYGTLAQRYVRDCDAKWVRGGDSGEPILGTGDIQSLADLCNSCSIIQDMRVVPVTKQAMFQLAVATVVPVAPGPPLPVHRRRARTAATLRTYPRPSCA
jgi:hypothetical protein